VEYFRKQGSDRRSQPGLAKKRRKESEVTIKEAGQSMVPGKLICVEKTCMESQKAPIPKKGEEGKGP